jgi:integrase
MLRQMASGTCTFYAVCNVKGEGRVTRLSIGKTSTISLAAARLRAGEIAEALALGRIVETDISRARRESREAVEAERAAKEAAKAEAERRKALRGTTVDECFRAYAVNKLRKLKSGADAERDLQRVFVDRWSGRQIGEIRRSDVVEVVTGMVDRGTPAAARSALALLRAMFSWCVERGVLEHSPCDHVRGSRLCGKIKPRSRSLSDGELRLLWRAAEKLGTYGDLVRLLLLLGLRLRECAHIADHEIEVDDNGTTWLRVPAERMKSERAHAVPLAATARAIIEASPRRGARSMVLTEPRTGRPLTAFSRIKKYVDEAVAKVAAETGAPGIAPWTFHDLRRTMRSGLAACGVADHVAERAIAHQPQGIIAVYNHHKYTGELVEAFEAWERRLLAITTGGNVVVLRTGAAPR